MKRYIALLALLLIGSKAFAQALGYGYPTMPSIHQAAAGGGAAASASATASPAFIAATAKATATASVNISLPASVHAGDCAIAVTAQNSAETINLTLLQWGALQADYNWTSGGFMDTLEKLIAPQDIVTGSLTFTNVPANHPVCVTFFRYVTCSNDQVSSDTKGTSTAPRPTSITTTLNGDAIISLAMVNGSTGLTYTPPTGYTNDVYLAPVTGVSWGCYEDHLTGNQSTAGATQPAAGTLSVSNDWGAKQLALINRGGTP